MCLNNALLVDNHIIVAIGYLPLYHYRVSMVMDSSLKNECLKTLVNCGFIKVFHGLFIYI